MCDARECVFQLDRDTDLESLLIGNWLGEWVWLWLKLEIECPTGDKKASLSI